MCYTATSLYEGVQGASSNSALLGTFEPMKRVTFLVSFTVNDGVPGRWLERFMKGVVQDMRATRFYNGIKLIQDMPEPGVCLHRETPIREPR